MLSYITVHSIDEKLALFREIDPAKSRWIVSDLKSRAYLEKARLQQFGFLEGESIVRARDFWTSLSERYFPDYRILDDCLMEIRLRHFLDDQFLTELRRGDDFAWARRPGAHKTLFKYVTYLMPILNSPQALPAVREWFVSDEQRLARWGHWFIAAAEAWAVLDQEKLLVPAWLSGFLAYRLNEAPGFSKDARSLYFDFGPELLPGESDLIEALSLLNDVSVVVPSRSWQARDRSLFKSYQRLESAAKRRPVHRQPVQQTHSDVLGEPEFGVQEYRRFSSMLAEVKDAVGEIRQWLDHGVKTEEIGILAADIGLYWPVLEAHLRCEGIPIDRPVKASLQTLPDFQKWLARLRLVTNDFDQTDLEFEWSGKLSEFDRMYTRFYDLEDIQRDAKLAIRVEELTKKSFADKEERISFSVFCDRAQILWPSEKNFSALEILFQELEKQNSRSLNFAFKDWAKVAEATSSNLELQIRDSTANGIACLDISSAEYFRGQCIYVLGLSEDALRRQQALHVIDRDVIDLSASTGFDLPFPATRQLEWELPWMLNSKRKKTVLTFPESNFDGSPLTPSITWLKGSVAGSLTHERRTPQISRWDQIQRQPFNQIGQYLDWSTRDNTIFDSAFHREVKKEQYALWPFADWKLRLRRISPSLLQTYSNCPFVTLIERVWGQSQLPDLDLDVDVMTRGKLLHRVFETLLESGVVPNLSREQIEIVVRQSMADIELQIGEPRLLPAMERRISKIAVDFLERESEWRKEYPQTRTIARELPVEGWIDLSSGELRSKENQTTMAFKGQIDRVDEDDKHRILILDYKSSGTSLNSHNLWLKKNQLQLGLYMESVIQALTKPVLPSLEIVAAQYFVMKDFSRTRGLVIADEAHDLVRVSSRSKAKMSREDFDKFREELKTHVASLFVRMESGEWIPHPRDPEACDTCTWRGLCRAPHLL